MQKIPCLFVRDFNNRPPTLTEQVTPGCEWVMEGEGVATRKWDGTSCAIIEGKLYKRYEAKKDRTTGGYKTLPVGAIPCDEPDPVTGHWPHWVLVGDEPESKWHREALKQYVFPFPLLEGTYELIGPAINNNADHFDTHVLARHGEALLNVERTHAGIKEFLENHNIEGIVFHHPDGHMCKIRRKDFGFSWGKR